MHTQPNDVPSLFEITTEFIQEVKDLLGRSVITDTIFPPLIFVSTYSWFGLSNGFFISIAFCVVVMFSRWMRGEHIIQVFSGVAGVLLALGITQVFQDARTYYIPGLIFYIFVTIACTSSAFSQKPFLVWTSVWYRKWPREWYVHPQVLPVYQGATLFWAGFFLMRTIVQALIYLRLNFYALVVVDFLTGWPTTLLLLYITLVWGRRKFIALGGPSVDEFITKAEPPYRSQRQGF